MSREARKADRGVLMEGRVATDSFVLKREHECVVVLCGFLNYFHSYFHILGYRVARRVHRGREKRGRKLRFRHRQPGRRCWSLAAAVRMRLHRHVRRRQEIPPIKNNELVVSHYVVKVGNLSYTMDIAIIT